MKFSHVGFLIVTKRRQFKWNYARKTLSEDVKLLQFKMSYDDCIVLLNSNKPIAIILLVFVKCKIWTLEFKMRFEQDMIRDEKIKTQK